MKKSFIIIGTIVNFLVSTAFIVIGRDMMEPHQPENGVLLATLAILVIFLGWSVTLAIGRKMPERIPDAVACSYVAAIIVFAVTAGVAMNSWTFAVTAAVAAMGVLGVAFALLYLLCLINKRHRP